MIDLDQIIDAYEEAVATEGVLSVDLHRFAPKEESGLSEESRSRIVVELLRVWMEYRWKSQHPVTVLDCIHLFPDRTFAQVDLDSLQYEEQRQRQIFQSRTIDRSGKRRTVEQLPAAPSAWGDFQLLQVLGKGAFAKVYLARQGDLADRLVAVKLTFRETQEANWLARLQHSSIVPIYSVHRIDDVYGICMPYLGNSTLADLLKELPRSVVHGSRSIWNKSRLGRSGTSVLSTIRQRHSQIDTLFSSGSEANPKTDTHTRDADRTAEKSSNTDSGRYALDDSQPLPPLVTDSSNDESNSPTSQFLSKCDYVEAVAWIGAQLADALAYSHRLGILHCDIKPANVLLARDGQPRLLDFNVSARATESLANLEAPMGGTIPYMAPEHRRAIYGRDHVDSKSDVYSLGVVLFELLTGSLPDPTVTLREHENNSKRMRTEPRRLNTNVSPALNAIVAKCLQAESAHRYRNADELCEDLYAQCHNRPLIHQREPSFRERAIKWTKRHPRLSSATSIAIVGILLLILSGFAFVSRKQALQEAHWQNRLNVLERRLPVSIAMLTSIEVAPHLRTQAMQDLNYTLSLMMVDDSSPARLDPRWGRQKNLTLEDQVRSDLEQLIYVARGKPWREPGTLEPAQGSTSSLLEQKIGEIETYFGFPIADTSHRAGKPYQYNEIRRLLRDGKLTEAREALASRSPNELRSYTGWWLLGNTYFHLEEYDQAQQAFTACIALRPEVSIAYFNRGNCRLMAHQISSAEQDFRRSVELNPEWHWARFNRALALRNLGRLDEAIDEINEGVEYGFRSVSLYRLRSEILQLQNKPIAAEADLRRALQCVPYSDQDWCDRGIIRLGTDPAQAASDFEKALEIAPRSIDAHQKLAYIYSELLNQPMKALEHLDALVDLAKDQWTHRAGRAVVHARNKNLVAALGDLQVLCQESINDPIVMYQIASCYALLAQHDLSTLPREVGSPSSEIELPKDQATHPPSSDSIQPSEWANAAIQWIGKTLMLQPQLNEMMESDPDLTSIANDPRFEALTRAARTLVSNSSSPKN